MKIHNDASAASGTRKEEHQALESEVVFKEAQLKLATPRMIAEPRKEGSVVRVALALALSKSKLLDGLVGTGKGNTSSGKTCLRDILAEAVREACGAVEAEVEAIADRPRDFLGGGKILRFITSSVTLLQVSSVVPENCINCKSFLCVDIMKPITK